MSCPDGSSNAAPDLHDEPPSFDILNTAHATPRIHLMSFYVTRTTAVQYLAVQLRLAAKIASGGPTIAVDRCAVRSIV